MQSRVPFLTVLRGWKLKVPSMDALPHRSCVCKRWRRQSSFQYHSCWPYGPPYDYTCVVYTRDSKMGGTSSDPKHKRFLSWAALSDESLAVVRRHSQKPWPPSEGTPWSLQMSHFLAFFIPEVHLETDGRIMEEIRFSFIRQHPCLHPLIFN